MIALSFARIHHENLALFGVLPLVFDDQADYRCVDAGHTLALTGTEALLATGAGTVRNTTTDQRFDVRHDLSQRQVDMVRHGGAINAARRTAPETLSDAAKRPTRRSGEGRNPLSSGPASAAGGSISTLLGAGALMLARELVLPHLLAARAADHPDRTFLEEVDGRSLTYADLHRCALTWADAYRRLGVQPGDRVAVMLPTGIDAVSAWLGLAWLRALEVPVNTGYVGRMLRYVLEHSGSTVLVTASAYLDRLSDVADTLTHLRTVVVHDSTEPVADLPFRLIGRREFLAGASPAGDLDGPGPADIATVMYTSGTTGPSKGVLMPWAQLHATASASIFTGDFGPGDAYYLPFPLFHISGKGPIYTFGLVGGRVVMRPSFNTGAFWDDIRRYRCTTTLLLGAMANFIGRQEPRADDVDTPLHTVVMVPLIPELDDFRQRFGVRVSTAFNMTEVSVPLHSDGWTLADLESCGKLRPGYELRVVDEDDEDVGPGRVGELIVRADEPWTLMAGYLDMPEATTAAWRNLWLHTGDAFRYDEDGNYYFLDRISDTIRRRGENISSAEVEVVVNEHPGVLESAAVAIPSEWGEDEVKIVVVARPGKTVDPRELIEFLTPRLPRFMLPRYIEVVTELPKTPTEKVRKVELRAQGITPATWDRESDR